MITTIVFSAVFKIKDGSPCKVYTDCSMKVVVSVPPSGVPKMFTLQSP